MDPPPSLDEVDEGFEGPPLLGPGVGPERPEAEGAVLFYPAHAEEVLEATTLHEGVALDVEEQVAGRRFGQATQPDTRLVGAQQLERRRLPGLPAGRHLQPGLVSKPGHRRPADPRDVVVGERGQFGHGGDAAVEQPPGLLRSQSGHEGEVVVLLPATVAGGTPGADGAVRHRPRVGVDPGRHRRLEAGLRRPVVGGDISQTNRHLLPTAQHDMEVLRGDALDTLQLLGVLAQLQDGRGPDVSSEFRVLGLELKLPSALGRSTRERKSACPRHMGPSPPPSRNVAWSTTSGRRRRASMVCVARAADHPPRGSPPPNVPLPRARPDTSARAPSLVPGSPRPRVRRRPAQPARLGPLHATEK